MSGTNNFVAIYFGIEKGLTSRDGFPARLGSRVGVCVLNIQAEPFAHVQFE